MNLRLRKRVFRASARLRASWRHALARRDLERLDPKAAMQRILFSMAGFVLFSVPWSFRNMADLSGSDSGLPWWLLAASLALSVSMLVRALWTAALMEKAAADPASPERREQAALRLAQAASELQEAEILSASKATAPPKRPDTL